MCSMNNALVREKIISAQSKLLNILLEFCALSYNSCVLIDLLSLRMEKSPTPQSLYLGGGSGRLLLFLQCHASRGPTPGWIRMCATVAPYDNIVCFIVYSYMLHIMYYIIQCISILIGTMPLICFLSTLHKVWNIVSIFEKVCRTIKKPVFIGSPRRGRTSQQQMRGGSKEEPYV